MTVPLPLPHVLRPAAAAALVAAVGAVVPFSPAAAATCSSDTGVSVVVDAAGLGGSLTASCVPGGGGDEAADLFEVHHDLTRTSQFPGVVCRVDGAPAEAECHTMPPADAYWGLFWSDGSGGWVYSNEGVDSLTVPEGGSVAFAWQDGGDQDLPGMPPPQTEAEPSASPSSGGGSGSGSTSHGGSGAGTPGGSTPSAGSPAATPSATTTPSDESVEDLGAGQGGRDQGERKNPGQKREERARPSPTPTSTPSPSSAASTTATSDPVEAAGGSVPVWVAPAAVAALFATAGVTAYLRRRTG